MEVLTVVRGDLSWTVLLGRFVGCFEPGRTPSSESPGTSHRTLGIPTAGCADAALIDRNFVAE